MTRLEARLQLNSRLTRWRIEMRGGSMEYQDHSARGERGERGFALVLAMLSLMLLTFLGLTLAATTSTELQIATNYRWGQQALYNAEAGLDTARIGLARLVVANPVRKWEVVLPALRTLPYKTWYLGDTPPPPIEAPVDARDFYKTDCDDRGGMGYGRVLHIGVFPELPDPVLGIVSRDGTLGRYMEVSSVAGQRINGAFTVWVRRNLLVGLDGKFADDENSESMTIVSEGIAPFTRSDSTIARTRQAVRIVETTLRLDLSAQGCRNETGQEGSSPTGEGYNSCAPLYADELTKALGSAFGAADVSANVVGGLRVQ